MSNVSDVLDSNMRLRGEVARLREVLARAKIVVEHRHVPDAPAQACGISECQALGCAIANLRTAIHIAEDGSL
jgi:hypothetical protein